MVSGQRGRDCGRHSKAGYDIAGKTGTAQVVGLGKDVGRNKDHSWFVSYAPAFKPEIAVLALIENSGFGSRHAAPAARAVYDVYFEKTFTEIPNGKLVRSRGGGFDGHQ